MRFAVFVAVLATLGVAPLWARDILVSTQEQKNVGTEVSSRIMAEAYRRLGHKMVLVPFPLVRSLLEADQGRVDAELFRQDGISASYPHLLRVPFVLTTGDLVAFTKSVRFPVKGWESLVPYELGYLRGQKSVESRLTSAHKARSFATLE